MSTPSILCLLVISDIKQNCSSGLVTRLTSLCCDSLPDYFAMIARMYLSCRITTYNCNYSLSTITLSSNFAFNDDIASPASLVQPKLCDLQPKVKQLKSAWPNDLNSLSKNIVRSLVTFKTIAEDLKSRMSTCESQISEIKCYLVNIYSLIDR